ncbi:MAG: STAS domain-containing protein [Candidatus Latescibacterota bacterium]
MKGRTQRRQTMAHALAAAEQRLAEVEADRDRLQREAAARGQADEAMRGSLAQQQEELRAHRDHLETLVAERTRELAQANEALKRHLAEVEAHEEVIRAQAHQLLELSTPVMQVWEGIVVAPLIGSLDTARAQRFTEVLLERIVARGCEVALVDITGVAVIDTQTAQHLLETVSAARLLGAQVILTGVRPAIAQTLVHLGIDLADVATRSSLAAGLRLALQELGWRCGGGAAAGRSAAAQGGPPDPWRKPDGR